MSEGFLSRWSRRKRGDAEEPPAPEEAPPPVSGEALPPVSGESLPPVSGESLPPVSGESLPPVSGEAPPPAPEPEAEFDLAQLPPLDSLTADSDFSVFFRPGVPAAIRGAALRKAWVADPLIRDYVSSLDYGWDFNAPASMPGFSLELGETGERLRKLIAQAVGEREEGEPAAAAVPVEAPAPEPAPMIAEAPAAVAEPAPPETSPAAEDEALLPARRHGGAMPA